MIEAVKFREALGWQERGDIGRADEVCNELLLAQPLHADAWHLRGLLAFQRSQFEMGIQFIRRSLTVNATQPAAHANIGAALLELGRFEEALTHFNDALALQPGPAATFHGRGQALQKLGRLSEAVDCFDRALSLAPRDSDLLANRGDALFDLGRYEEALASYDLALAAGPRSVELLNNRGNALRELSRYPEALASYEQALALEPTQPVTLNNRGNALLDLRRFHEALGCYEAALHIQPEFVAALDNQGLALLMADRPEDAAKSYARLLEIAPKYKKDMKNLLNVHCNLLNARSLCCDWTRYETDRATVLELVAEGKLLHPFPFLAIADSGALQLECARRFAAEKLSQPRKPLWRGEDYRHSRLRVAYVSGDFREHVVSYLMAGVFEQHDRERIETIGISLRPEDRSVTGQRVKAAFDRFADATTRSDREVADLLRSLEVDVVVDLMGFTRGNRLGIFAHRAAAVQVNYLGYPGTLGSPFMDYILADEFVIPPGSGRFYAEQVAYLPQCFQANDDRCVFGATPSRSEVGLPEEGTVLCCFNNSYKLTPALFDIWMRLLHETPDAVLWLLGTRPGTQENLLREAKQRGIDSQRLVFAGSMPYASHLARLRLADLFLDTLPYNAGATASDCLRAGVPVLTCAGETFAARMAGSLLSAVGLPELVTHSLHEYERTAVRLAREPEKLLSLKSRLAEGLSRSSLLDTARFCRQLEEAYGTMHERALSRA